MNIRKNILKKAWLLINEDSGLKKLYFFPGLLGIVFLTLLLVYQSIYTYVVILQKKEEAFEKMLKLLESDYTFTILIILAIFLIIYILSYPIFEGALIRYIYIKDLDGKTEYGESMSIGLYRFFGLFKYSNLFSEFKFMSVLNGYLFVIRFFDGLYIKNISIVFLFIFFFSAIINILFAYSKNIIVIEKKGVFEAITKSIKLSFLDIKATFKIYLFMFFLNFRVIINFLIFLSFPLLIGLIITLGLSKLFLTISIIILSIIFILFILFLGYINGVLEIFKTAIWFYTYKHLNTVYNKLENDNN